jgi:hypothetical protein
VSNPVGRVKIFYLLISLGVAIAIIAPAYHHQNPPRQSPPATHARIVGMFSGLFATKRKSQLADDDTAISIAIRSRLALCGYLGVR